MAPDVNDVYSKLHYEWNSCPAGGQLVRKQRLERIGMDRHNFSTLDSVTHLWNGLGLPQTALEWLTLPGTGSGLRSSFRIGHLAQASIALSALSAALVHSHRLSIEVPRVTVPLEHAIVEFQSERLYSIDAQPPPSMNRTIGGLHKTSDGYVRIHDSFPAHREGTKKLLGCHDDDDRSEVAAKIAHWAAIDLETAGIEAGLAMAALRTYEQWDVLPQARAVTDFPILIRKIANGPPGLSLAARSHEPAVRRKCLQGLRVVELSRVIATPVAGKTLAAHGADVLWVTSPKLADLPALYRDLSRGKRTIQLDLENPADLTTLQSLVQDADVFLQGYRPGSLAARGLSSERLLRSRRPNHGLICANFSAYGPRGPWSRRRGFDSLVQTCSGMNASEAAHYGDGAAARVMPCQALDHAGGYFMAAGINAALYKQATEGGSYEVDVSLAAVMKYLRSLGQYDGDSGFRGGDYTVDVREELFETKASGFGMLKAVRHSATIGGVDVGLDIMPKPLGSDQPEWPS